MKLEYKGYAITRGNPLVYGNYIYTISGDNGYISVNSLVEAKVLIDMLTYGK